MSGKDTKDNGGGLRFLYNPDTGEVFGRTGLSWFKITVFYIVFFACLAAFWTVMLVIFYQTLDAFRPKWTLDASLIGSVPGLGFRPRPPMSSIDSTLINFKGSIGERDTYKQWIDDLKTFVDQYKSTNENGEYLEECGAGPASAGKVCVVKPEEYTRNNSRCIESEDFGYRYGTPCVALKLNKIYGWKPEPYGDNDVPDQIKDTVRHQSIPGVVITCEGENAADQENMGEVQFFPHNNIDGKYFPFMNVPGYKAPFVFVHFKSPERGVLINVECKAWAKNIKHDRQERIGSVHFELMID